MAVGVPWERRGERCDEYIGAMKALWTTARSSFHGEFCAFDDVISYPKPVQQPHLPVLVGGNTAPALRRAARWGDGWYGWNLTIDALQPTVDRLVELLAAAGRSRDGFVVQVGVSHDGGTDELDDYVGTCARLGLDRVVLALPLSRRSFVSRLEQEASRLGLSS